MKMILVIEDTEVMTRLLVKYFSRYYVVDTVDTAERGLEKMEESFQRYHAILLDYMLPGMSGREFLMQVKSHPLWSTVPVIVQTADYSDDSLQFSMNNGAEYHIVKPYTMDEMAVILRGF